MLNIHLGINTNSVNIELYYLYTYVIKSTHLIFIHTYDINNRFRYIYIYG